MHLRFCLLLFVLINTCFPVRAELKVRVTQGSTVTHPIAVAEIQGGDAHFAQMGRELTTAFQRNFRNAGVFNIIQNKAFIQTSESATKKPNFRDWRVIGARFLLTGLLVPTMDGRVQLKYSLYNVLSQNMLDEQTIVIDKRSWRRLSHIASDRVYKKITGEDGFFDSEIAYVAERRSGQEILKQLALMDQDGQNHRFVTMGKNIVLTPRFSPKGRVVAYLDYGITNKIPKVYILNLDTGSRTLLGSFPGMTYAPRFSPDGTKIIMSATNSCGDSHIYLMDVCTKSKTQLTQGNSIDTSPCFSPDGKKIVFHSDRLGTKQLFVMNADGTNMKRISKGPGGYAAPVWAPKGDHIAFIKVFDGSFHIGVMKSDGTGERLITQGYIVEDPMWSPNGRMLIFTREWKGDRPGENGRRRIHMVDLSGHNEVDIPTPQGVNAITATWSASRG